MPDLLFDHGEVDRLAADLLLSPARLMAALVPGAQKAGVSMKSDMKRAASGHKHLAGLPRFVEYDVDAGVREVSVEVGFRKEGQGDLANIAAFGSVNNAPVMDITQPLTKEAPQFVRWCAQVAAKALL